MNIETFNNLFEEFVNKLLLKFDSEKLRFYKNTFLVIKRMKPYIPVYLFISNSINYKKEIINRDENFFIKNKKIKDNCSYFNIDSELIQLEKLSELILMPGLIILASRRSNLLEFPIRDCSKITIVQPKRSTAFWM